MTHTESNHGCGSYEYKIRVVLHEIAKIEWILARCQKPRIIISLPHTQHGNGFASDRPPVGVRDVSVSMDTSVRGVVAAITYQVYGSNEYKKKSCAS